MCVRVFVHRESQQERKRTRCPYRLCVIHNSVAKTNITASGVLACVLLVMLVCYWLSEPTVHHKQKTTELEKEEEKRKGVREEESANDRERERDFLLSSDASEDSTAGSLCVSSSRWLKT